MKASSHIYDRTSLFQDFQYDILGISFLFHKRSKIEKDGLN